MEKKKWISWGKMCITKEAGGLKIFFFSFTLIQRYIREMEVKDANKNNSLLYKMLCAKYGQLDFYEGTK